MQVKTADIKQRPRHRPGDHRGDGRTTEKNRHGLAALAGRQPLCEVIDDAGEETGLGGAQDEPQDIEAGFPAHKRHRHRRRAPGEHDARQPSPRAVALQQQVGGHFEDRVADKKQPGPQAVGRRADAQVGFHMAAYETDIDPIDVIDDEHHHEQRQHMALDLGRRAGKHGRVWRTLEDIHGQLPLIVF